MKGLPSISTEILSVALGDLDLCGEGQAEQESEHEPLHIEPVNHNVRSSGE